MFNVKIDKFNIQFTFAHYRNVGEQVGISDVTQCTMKVNGQAFHAVAACSENDKFDKEIGRKLSLARVLLEVRKKIELPHEVRFYVWQRYFHRATPNDQFMMDEHVNGKLDQEYAAKLGSDDLVNMA